MGHIVNSPRAYRLLQQRLDRNVTGAPDSPVLRQILELLFQPDEAELAAQIPTRFVSLRHLALRTGMEPDALAATVTSMAARGLVFDLEHEGKRYVALAPVVIGFFEFTFMRTRPESYPTHALSQLFEEYMFGDERFAHPCGRRHQHRPPLIQMPDSFYLERIQLETAVLSLSLVLALGMLHQLPALLACFFRIHIEYTGSGGVAQSARRVILGG